MEDEEERWRRRGVEGIVLILLLLVGMWEVSIVCSRNKQANYYSIKCFPYLT